jgi:D-glycero-alpha-D-manno-heptose 1-phosphate guanylyltransferase
MEAIVLAGGLGTRLSSRLVNCPKPMAPINGRPFLEILLDQLVDAGCSRITLSVGHLHEVIERAFGKRYRDANIEYAVEDAPLGTGGAIRFALERVVEDAVLTVNGDTFLDADLSALFQTHTGGASQITMAVTHVPNTARYGGVKIEGGKVVGFTEKGLTGPGWINGGIYILDKLFAWPSDLPERFSFETDVLAAFVSELYPNAHCVAGYFLDIGIPEDLDRAQVELPKLAALGTRGRGVEG